MAIAKIACVQMDVEIGNVETNRSRIMERIKYAAETARAKLLVIFPECALTGYCFDSLEEAAQFAELIDGRSSEMFAEVCSQTGTYVIVGFIEKDGTDLYNAAMVVGPNGVIGSYRKVHLPFLGVDRFLKPGNKPFAVFDLPIGRVGVNICYDISFPEGARALKLLGAELIVLPTNWPEAAWRTPEFVVNTRAIENHVNFAAVNRVGVERGWKFIGRSKVVDFNGDTIAEAPLEGKQDLWGWREGEQILFADVDIQEANKNRIVNVPGAYEFDRMADRRPEFYGPITAATKSQSGAA